MVPFVDMFHLIAYDYADASDKVTGHQANAYDGAINTDQAIDYYLDAGIPAHKIILGLRLFGIGFSNTDGIGSPFDGVSSNPGKAGVLDYNVLPKPGATEHSDPERMASWSYDPQLRELISYYIRDRGLGGAIFWELGADDPHGEPLSRNFNFIQVA